MKCIIQHLKYLLIYIDPNVEVYQTTSSPFKVTNIMENVYNRSEIIKNNNLQFVSASGILAIMQY